MHVLHPLQGENFSKSLFRELEGILLNLTVHSGLPVSPEEKKKHFKKKSEGYSPETQAH